MINQEKTKDQVNDELDNIKIKYKQTEKELADRRFELKEYFEKLPMLAYKGSWEGKILDCNDLAVNTLGYKRKEELIGKPLITTIYAPSSREKAKKLFLKWKKSGKIRNEELYIITKQGKPILIILNVDTIYDMDGKPLYSLSTQIDITRRKQAEEELHRTEEEQRSIFDSSPVAITTADSKARIVKCNQATLDLYGYSSENEVIGKNIFSLIAPRDKENAKKILNKVSKQILVKDMEYKCLRKDGNEFPGELSFAAINGSSGKLTGLITMTRDITKRKKAEFEMKKFIKTIETSKEAISIHSSDGKILFTNQAMNDLFGYEKGELIGKYPLTLNAGPMPENIAKRIMDSTVKNGYWEGEIRNKQKDGTEFSSYARISALRDTKGKTINFLSTQHSITEQKRMENVARKSEEKYRYLFEDSPMALREEDWSELKKYIKSLKDSGVKDFSTYLENHPDEVENLASKKKIITVNKANLDLCGAKTKKEYLNGIKKTRTEEYNELFKETLICIEKGKTQFEYEVPKKTLKGERRYIRLKWAVAPGYESTFSKVLISAIDLTGKKRVEEELKMKELELRKQTIALEQKNIALKEVIAQIEFEKRKIANEIQSNVSFVINPILENLKNEKVVKNYASLIQHHLEGLTSSYGIKMKEKGNNLTQREFEICNLIKGGLSSKESASFLNVSCRTIDKHREKIRHKLGISSKKINLASFLREL